MRSPVPILATDLDGTLIPSDPRDPEKSDTRALRELSDRVQRADIEIVFVTGRYFQSVLNAIHSFQLPYPQWIVCDVGSSLYQRVGQEYRQVMDYHDHLNELTDDCPPSTLNNLFSGLAELRLQETEKQTTHKLSFYCPASDLGHYAQTISAILQSKQLTHNVMYSLNPFDGEGLIDILPRGVNKAYALQWWSHWQSIDQERIVFAGDSGNDFDALTCQFRCILVGNAEASFADRIKSHHRIHRTSHRFHHAQATFTAGVIEGCYHYGLLRGDV